MVRSAHMTNGHPLPPPQHKATAKDRLLQTIAILGLIAVLLLGAWGIIQLAFNLPGVFQNLGGSLKELFNVERSATSTPAVLGITVTAPQAITSGAPFTLSWEHAATAGQYAYTVSYSCVEGVSMKAPLPNGTYKDVACATPFNYTNASARTTLSPVITRVTPGKVTFTVSAVRLSTNQVAVSGIASSDASKGTTVQTKTSVQPTAKYQPASPSPKTYSGYPDLAVQINSVNSLSSVYGRTAVQFTIANMGTNVAYAGWTFTAFLPTSGGYNFNSQPQQPLYPGDKIVYTLTYDQPYQNYGGYGAAPVTIVVDPQNQVPESIEANNTATAAVY